jgi:hypothetical protein
MIFSDREKKGRKCDRRKGKSKRYLGRKALQNRHGRLSMIIMAFSTLPDADWSNLLVEG